MRHSEHIITSKHYLVLSVCAYVGGMCLTFMVSGVIQTALFILFVIAATGLASVTVCRKLILGSRIKHTFLPCVLIVFTLLGIFRILSFEASKDARLRSYSGAEAWVYGTVLTEPQLTSNGYSYSFELDVAKINDDSTATGKMLITTPSAFGRQASAGDEICCWCLIEEFYPSEIPGLFNYYTYLRSKNIFVIAEAQNLNPAALDKSFSASDLLSRFGIKIRASFSKAIDTAFQENTDARSILKGVLLGDKALFSDELYEKFANAGISHVVAVSGLHLVILTSFLTFLLKSTGLHRKACLIFSIPFVIMFSSIASFSPSVSRASIMFILTTLATLFSCRYDPVTALFCALGIIVTISPFSILSQSLILSFMATLGILIYSKYIKESILSLLFFRVYSKNFVIKFFCRISKASITAIALTVSSFIGTIYFLGLFFGQFSKVQFLTNLWIVPIVWLVFCLGYIMCVVFVISPNLAIIFIKPPLKLCLYLVQLTVNYFGAPSFAAAIPSFFTTFPGFILYISSALIIYFCVKLIYDNMLTSAKEDIKYE